MNGQLLKKLNENCPQFIKKIFSKIIRNKLIKNKIFEEQYLEIQNFESLSSSEKEEILFKKLKDLLIYCYENTEYYRKEFDNKSLNPYEFKDFSELSKLNIIDKNTVINSHEQFVSKESINYYISSTSGTTGKPLTVFLDKDSIYKERAFVYHNWSRLGYDYKSSKILTFRKFKDDTRIYKFDPLYNAIVMSPIKLNKNTIYEYIRIINKYKPDYIQGYPSILMNFCKLLEEHQLNISIKGVFFISENLEKFQKEYVEKILKCKSSTFYGHTERLVFGEEDNCNYKFNQLYGFTELIPTQIENEFKIVATGFLNKKMPLLRYDTGDVVRKDAKENMKVIGHKNSELIIGKNDELLAIASIDFYCEPYNKLRMFQFVQNERGILDLNIVPQREITEKDTKLMIDIWNERAQGSVALRINFVEDIIRTTQGKYRMVVQNIL